jgi:SAM-dependent methyltransferase
MDETRRDAFEARVFGAAVSALDLLHLYVGDRLGLYRVMASGQPYSPGALASAAGIADRYAREWLEHEAVAGTVEVAERGGERQYVLPAEHAEVLTDETSLAYLAPVALGVVGLARTLPRVTEAFKDGSGIAYEEYGADLRDAISRGNRPMFTHLLASQWLPQVPGVAERLAEDPPARVADVGCGVGWSSIAIARGFPKSEVHGLDLDAASIAEASANAETEGVADRVRFDVRDAADPRLAGTFDLVCAFETIHDMTDPVKALRAMRSLRAEGGTVLVVDERCADSFTTDVEDGERFQQGWSALHCLPLSMLEPPAAGTGTIMRAPTLRMYAQAAGFADIEVLPIENGLWRFYLLH